MVEIFEPGLDGCHHKDTETQRSGIKLLQTFVSLCLCGDIPLLVAQTPDRVDAKRASRRDVAGDEANR
jgi:hypothetical protein